jgi:ferric-dicitrate binding protein FerR (iron transport regulator)
VGVRSDGPRTSSSERPPAPLADPPAALPSVPAIAPPSTRRSERSPPRRRAWRSLAWLGVGALVVIAIVVLAIAWHMAP